MIVLMMVTMMTMMMEQDNDDDDDHNDDDDDDVDDDDNRDADDDDEHDNINADDDNLQRDSLNHSITYKNQSIQVFEKVRVRIWVKVIQETQKELMLDLVHPIFRHGPGHSGDFREPSRKRALSESEQKSKAKKKRGGSRKRTWHLWIQTLMFFP